jgi:hypothetical protein
MSLLLKFLSDSSEIGDSHLVQGLISKADVRGLWWQFFGCCNHCERCVLTCVGTPLDCTLVLFPFDYFFLPTNGWLQTLRQKYAVCFVKWDWWL